MAHPLRLLALANCLVPAGLVLTYAATGQLGANPVDFVLRAAGISALVFLLASLAVTPLRKSLSWTWLGPLRRLLGLSAFFYGLAHFLIYLWPERSFNPVEIGGDIVERPFITAGFAALFFMVPLAATSNAYMMRRLGGARWQRLHKRVYGIAILAVLHYAWLVKADLRGPILSGAILGLLLLFRIVDFARRRRAV